VLGLLAVARKPLSLRELSQITGVRQRELHDGIGAVRPFLAELDGGYALYHARFHDYVMRELLYADEIPDLHRKIAQWLGRAESRDFDYRWQSLTYHLHAAGEYDALHATVDAAFLAGKLRRAGYGVLEDVELLSRSLMRAGDARLVERSVSLVEGLREAAGGDLLEDASRAVRGPMASRREREVIVLPVAPPPEFDVFAALLPRGAVSADFVEIVAGRHRLTVAIGDAPSSGIKSAFIARFIANLFRQQIESSESRDLSAVVEQLDDVVVANPFFDRVSMLCVDLDAARRTATLASAGHVYPLLYSARRRSSDRLPVRGQLLHAESGVDAGTRRFDRRRVEMYPGDVLALVSDGLTEGHLLHGDPYGYRFARVIERLAGAAMAVIGEAILEDWVGHRREDDTADDVTLVLISTTGAGSGT
jgi:hypothetical protein